MSNKLTVHTKEFRFDVQDMNDTIYIHRTYVPAPDSRIQDLQPTELVFSGSPEEARYIANALLQVIGAPIPLFTLIEKDEIK